MSRQNEIISYLEKLSSIGRFYLHQMSQKDRYLIHYFDAQGVSWALMEDDGSFVNQCINYLLENGAPVFRDIEKLKAFEKEQKIEIMGSYNNEA